MIIRLSSLSMLSGLLWGALQGNVIQSIQGEKTAPLIKVSKAFWTLKNDKTERPGVGETISQLERTGSHFVMKGLLASLPGSWGRVGFSLMETAITKPIQKTEGIVFKAKGTEGAWFSVLVKDRQSDQPNGTLTFQWDFEANGTETEYVALWKDFTPKIRGKSAPGYELDLYSVHSLSFQISRSTQQKWHETVPLEFELEL